MRKKIFTFLLALATSVGLSWATTITWDASKVSSMAMDISSGSDSKTNDGITVTAVSTGDRVIFGGFIEIFHDNGGGGYLTFTSSVGNITQIDIVHPYSAEWNNGNAGWPAGWYEAFDGGTFTWSGTPAASVTLTGDAPSHFDGGSSIVFTIEDGGGSEPATGLQVVEVTSELYAGWNSNSNQFTVDALPGFQAVTFDEAKEWTEVPTSGTAVLVYRTNGDNARVIHFFDGTITGDYDIETDFNQIYENITIFGNRYFYTAGGGSTPTEVDVEANVDPHNAGVYYSTFYDSSNKYELPSGVEAFVADLSGSDLVLTKIAGAGQVIPADNAVILKANSDNITLTQTDEEAVSFSANNDLEGVDAVTTLASLSIDADECYVLSGTNTYGVGFYKIDGSSLKANKAYVIYDGEPSGAPRRLRFVFDQATSMENVQGDKAQSTKVVEDGVLYIINNGVKYNAQGQIVK